MLAASVCVVTLLVAAVSCADTQDDVLPYKSSARKGLKSATMRQLDPDYIPDKQCSGLISHLSCPPLVTRALQVEVLDREQYAEVRIDDSLGTATVFRRPNPGSGVCEGEAHVRVSLSCGGYRRMLGGTGRLRRSPDHRTYLPPAPVPYTYT